MRTTGGTPSQASDLIPLGVGNSFLVEGKIIATLANGGTKVWEIRAVVTGGSSLSLSTNDVILEESGTESLTASYVWESTIGTLAIEVQGSGLQNTAWNSRNSVLGV